MIKRRISGHEECLRIFGSKFKKTVKENLLFWEAQNTDLAGARSAAFSLVLRDVIDAAEECGVPLQDIGVADFDIPSKYRD